jgi:hypothetical protein
MQDSMTQTNGHAAERPMLATRLRTAADMSPRWEDVELDFDTAAEDIIQAHKGRRIHTRSSHQPLRARSGPETHPVFAPSLVRHEVPWRCADIDARR